LLPERWRGEKKENFLLGFSWGSRCWGEDIRKAKEHMISLGGQCTNNKVENGEAGTCGMVKIRTLENHRHRVIRVGRKEDPKGGGGRKKRGGGAVDSDLGSIIIGKVCSKIVWGGQKGQGGVGWVARRERIRFWSTGRSQNPPLREKQEKGHWWGGGGGSAEPGWRGQGGTRSRWEFAVAKKRAIPDKRFSPNQKASP